MLGNATLSTSSSAIVRARRHAKLNAKRNQGKKARSVKLELENSDHSVEAEIEVWIHEQEKLIRERERPNLEEVVEESEAKFAKLRRRFFLRFSA